MQCPRHRTELRDSQSKENRDETQHACLCRPSNIRERNAGKRINFNMLRLIHYIFELGAHQFCGIDIIKWHGLI